MISVDDAEKNKRFAEQEGADFPILSDPGKEVATAYGVLSAGGVANRWTFYIGGDGKLLFIDKGRTQTGAAGETLTTKLEKKVATNGSDANERERPRTVKLLKVSSFASAHVVPQLFAFVPVARVVPVVTRII
jgi:hypothetical protein